MKKSDGRVKCSMLWSLAVFHYFYVTSRHTVECELFIKKIKLIIFEININEDYVADMYPNRPLSFPAMDHKKESGDSFIKETYKYNVEDKHCFQEIKCR